MRIEAKFLGTVAISFNNACRHPIYTNFYTNFDQIITEYPIQ